MAKTLEEVRQRWPKANYAPRADCKYCDGTGERKKKPGLPCICIFVSHDLCDFAADSLAATARKIREELS